MRRTASSPGESLLPQRVTGLHEPGWRIELISRVAKPESLEDALGRAIVRMVPGVQAGYPYGRKGVPHQGFGGLAAEALSSERLA